MIVRSVRSRSPLAARRLDARYFCTAGVQATERIAVVAASGVPMRRLGGEGGMACFTGPSRFSRARAASAEDSVPYLRPYDVFDYLPRPSDHLSRARTPGIESYRPRRGIILQTCSGRNLGPSVMADSYLTKFVVSDDMIRIDIDTWDDAAFVLAFLNSPTGQALVRQGKTGSVIDHLSVAHVSEIAVPWFENPLRTTVARRMSDAVTKRERARLDLDTVQSAYNARLPAIDRPHRPRQGWTLRCDCRQTRLDAAFHNPVVSQVRTDLLACGGSYCRDAAEAHIPGRYVRYYVGPEFGRPIVSGAQLLQSRLVNLRYEPPWV